MLSESQLCLLLAGTLENGSMSLSLLASRVNSDNNLAHLHDGERLTTEIVATCPAQVGITAGAEQVGVPFSPPPFPLYRMVLFSLVAGKKRAVFEEMTLYASHLSQRGSIGSI